MTNQEFSDEFDVLYNNVTSNQAPGLDEYEKSVFLTKAQDEIVKSYFDPKSNKVMEGFDGSERRQIDFSMIMATATVKSGDTAVYYLQTNKTLTEQQITNIESASNAEALKTVLDGIAETQTIYKSSDTALSGKITAKILPESVTLHIDTSKVSISAYYSANFYRKNNSPLFLSEVGIQDVVNNNGAFDTRKETKVVPLPEDVLMILNEQVQALDQRGIPRIFISVPITYDEYSRLMAKPFKRPIKNQVWRILTSQNNTKKAELIFGPQNTFKVYSIRYVKRPRAIRLIDFTDTGVTIGDTIAWGGTDNGITAQECELDPILHPEILQRAVELAKAAYLGDLSTTIALGQSSQTPIGAVTQSRQQ